MKLIIAEKKSVGSDIARIVGARTNKENWYEGNGYLVSWAAGHLVEKTADTADIPWDEAHLPLLPEGFKLIPRTIGAGKDRKSDPRCVKQLKVLKDLARQCTSVINAGDAGREGEVIQRYIYEYIGLNKPVERLWVSSMTDEAIRDALADLHPGRDYDNLFAAGDQRTMADWLVGINATRALTAAAQKQGIKRFYSLGRVQTPTLALVCKRYIENRDFKSTPFWEILVESERDSRPFTLTSERRFDTEDEAQRLRTAVASQGTLVVKSFEQIERDEQPPLLHDITTLEKEAINRLGFTGAKADELLESLYMKKVMTYPRTGSNYIPDDVMDTIPTLLGRLAGVPDKTIATAAESLRHSRLNRRSVDASKVTDHHALLITPNDPTKANLTPDEWKIYNLVAVRMLQAFSEPCHVRVSKVVAESCGESFAATGRLVLRPGWKGILGEDENNSDDATTQTLPALSEGDTLPANSTVCKEGKTKPKPLYTEASLRDAMKTAGKDSDDQEIKDALKDIGIGTPATRTAIIETLKLRTYIKEEKKKIVPTETGLAVYNIVKDMMIASPELTGRWEAALSFIAEGKMDPESFNKKVRVYAAAIVKEILEKDTASIKAEQQKQDEPLKCPRCGALTMKIWPENAKCPDCGLFFWRTILGKKLSDTQTRSLLEKGALSKVSGLTSKKTGNKFDAGLRLVLPDMSDTDPKTKDRCNVTLVFDEGPKLKSPVKKGHKALKKIR